MLASTAIGLFLIFWTSILLFDLLMRRRDVKFYTNWADRIGLRISYFQLQFYTSRGPYIFNQPLLNSNPEHYTLFSRFIRLWFSFGSTISLLCFFGVIIYLSKILLDEVDALYLKFSGPLFLSNDNSAKDFTIAEASAQQSTVTTQQHKVTLIPIVPGVNIPFLHIPLIIVVLVIASIFHELGHALAAACANIPVRGFGFFFVAIYPGAFTEMEKDALARSTIAQKMRVYTAGIWHNIVLALLAYLFYASSPWLFSPLYSVNNGVYVEAVDRRSGLYGIGGLQRGDIIHEINDCTIRNLDDWFSCISRLKSGNQTGYCLLEEDLLPNLRANNKVLQIEDELQCCDLFNTSHMCFHFAPSSEKTNLKKHVVRKSDDTLFVPEMQHLAHALGLQNSSDMETKVIGNQKPRATSSDNEQLYLYNLSTHKFACLSGRYVTGQKICNSLTACSFLSSPIGKMKHCVYPALYNDTKLLRFTMSGENRAVIYIGNVMELINYVRVNKYVNRFFFAPIELLNIVDLFVKYIIAFSLGMALLNSVPCFALDGQFICATLVDFFFSNSALSRRQNVLTVLLFYGTCLLFMNLLISFAHFFRFT